MLIKFIDLNSPCYEVYYSQFLTLSLCVSVCLSAEIQKLFILFLSLIELGHVWCDGSLVGCVPHVGLRFLI